ncbi:DnaB-like replicative helicase [Mycobacterium phage Tiger]|uniref:DnaB-like dsDNA helicase n=2 Tax=Benedictvirus TaxID=2946819 RepID=H9NCX7_9CAUD|nr:DnaB-like replicative helicase [Mycobacterium phage Conspiracy]YP_008859090.1 DnaB-like replicative helicase [Mycobacterium phage Jovo]YP_009607707.1 DnaB-like replicative helicase [Mycobacterium phage Tiger]ATW60037.1 DnaB-like dsDNA helicase [Mycobacterium phage Phlorence]ATW60457.1 DnaB-like dsDNA helicase [Mycobacterium phage ForGetIt]ATW61010.1 DnaB-like dsDNA helicase [Mycobacterium phage Aragog]ATW61252.1 DnaB-like dsDNA helicase [Mycobacterium phage AgentM]QGJ97261.1 DnaB-like dsD
MYTPRQSLYIKGSAGDPLPTVWETLDNKGTRFLRGQLCLICAAPGIGKSAFALTYALKAGVPTLYFSADSDAFTQLTRSVSILTGMTMEKSARQIREESLEPEALYALEEAQVMFKYDASPTLTQIEDPLEAFAQKYGEYPALTVIDNITNIRIEGGANEDDPFSGLEGLMDYLHDMGRQTASCVAALHHVKGDFNNGNVPIPLNGIKGQIGRVPEMVLTLHRITNDYGPDAFNVSTVKNRGGKSDPSGQDFATLDFVGDTMQITDPL